MNEEAGTRRLREGLTVWEQAPLKPPLPVTIRWSKGGGSSGAWTSLTRVTAGRRRTSEALGRAHVGDGHLCGDAFQIQIGARQRMSIAEDYGEAERRADTNTIANDVFNALTDLTNQ